MRLRQAIAVSALLLAFVVSAGQVHAQGKKTTSHDTTMAVSRMPGMAAMMDSVGPMFSTVMGGMYGGIIDFLARPETAAKLATFARNYFDELIKRGFTRDEALLLVRGVGIPGPMGR